MVRLMVVSGTMTTTGGSDLRNENAPNCHNNWLFSTQSQRCTKVGLRKLENKWPIKFGGETIWNVVTRSQAMGCMQPTPSTPIYDIWLILCTEFCLRIFLFLFHLNLLIIVNFGCTFKFPWMIWNGWTNKQFNPFSGLIVSLYYYFLVNKTFLIIIFKCLMISRPHPSFSLLLFVFHESECISKRAI